MRLLDADSLSSPGGLLLCGPLSQIATAAKKDCDALEALHKESETACMHWEDVLRDAMRAAPDA